MITTNFKHFTSDEIFFVDILVEYFRVPSRPYQYQQKSTFSTILIINETTPNYKGYFRIISTGTLGVFH